MWISSIRCVCPLLNIAKRLFQKDLQLDNRYASKLAIGAALRQEKENLYHELIKSMYNHGNLGQYVYISNSRMRILISFQLNCI